MTRAPGGDRRWAPPRRWAFLFACLALFALAGHAAAQEAKSVTAAPGIPAPAVAASTTTLPGPVTSIGPTAQLSVFNRPIVTFRQQFLGVTPQERARLAQDRIESVLSQGGPGKVVVTEIPQGRLVTVDGEYVFVITPDDAATGAGISLESTAQGAAVALARVVEETREARDGRRMLHAAVVSAIATAVLVVVLWGLARLGRVLTRRITALAEVTTDKLRVGGGTMQRQRVLGAIRGLVHGAGWLLYVLVIYEWLGFVLSQFPFTRPWGEQLNQFLISTATGFLIAIARALPDLLVAIVIFVIAYWIDQLQRNFFDGVRSGRFQVGWVDHDTAPPTRRIATIIVWIFALVMAYPYIPGSETDAFKGLSVLVGLMVTVGASSIVGQAASGLILMYARTYRPGDFVRIGDSEGTVVVMGMFTTRIRTGMGVEMTIPNSSVLGTVTQNYSRVAAGSAFIVDATVTIGYDVPWRQVDALLTRAALRCDGIVAEPPPRVFKVALSDFYVEYRLVCQAEPEEPRPRAELMSNLNAAIVDLFNEHGVQIMSPHYFGDPRDAKVVPPAQWYAAPAAPPPSPSTSPSPGGDKPR